MIDAAVSKTVILDHIKNLRMLSIFDFSDVKKKLEKKLMDGIASN